MSTYQSTGLVGNPHFGQAELIVQRVLQADDWYADDDPALARAQIVATLALAYEQRTATLVTLLVASETSVRIAGIDYSELADEIKLRVGGVRK